MLEFIRSYYLYIAMFLSLVISISMSAIIYIKRKRQQADIVLRARTELVSYDEIRLENIKKKSERFRLKHKRRYNKIQLFLSRAGANYMLGRIIEPMEYIVANIVLSIVVAFVGFLLLQVPGLIIGAIIGYNLLYVTLVISNNRDNSAIIEDIRAVYETLKIRTESGMFLTSSIHQCYKVVENKRLKEALLSLSASISTTNDIISSVDAFQYKFKNRYIDQLCVTLRQSFESGKTLESLNNVSNNLTNMQKVLEVEKKNKLEGTILICQILILICLVVVMLFGVFSMFSSAMFNA